MKIIIDEKILNEIARTRDEWWQAGREHEMDAEIQSANHCYARARSLNYALGLIYSNYEKI